MNKKVSTKSNFSTHLLQSKQWQKYEELEGHSSFRLEGKNYTISAILHETPFSNYLFVPYGPSAANKTALLNALRALKRFAESKNISFIRIEPTLPLDGPEMAKISQKLNLKLKKIHDIDPKTTWQLDLSPDKDTLLGAINPNKTRPWRNHSKKHMRIRTSTNPSDVRILTNFLKKVSQNNHFTPQTESHLKNQLKSGFATLYIVDLWHEGVTAMGGTPAESSKASEDGEDNGRQDPRAIAAALVYDYGDTRYYAHAAADFDHRKLEAGSIIVLQSILDAKDSGQKIYDFWGITTSEDKNHPWYGFTKFKKSFGGHQIDYAGTYDLILNPFKYRLYSFFRSLNRKIRKILKKS